MRYLYSVLFYLLLPLLFIRLWWRSRRMPAYRERIWERIGYYPFKLDKCIWVHAVSMGETLAAVPLIKALQERYPHLPIVVTTMTPTGAEQVKKSFADSVKHVYVPYDFPGAVNRFLRAMNPVIGIIMETEMWPNLLSAMQQKNIPVCLLNARLSEKSARGYARISSLTRKMLSCICTIAAHGHKDAARFIELGADEKYVVVTGNLKFDLQLTEDLIANSNVLRQQLGGNRFIWIAASTHEGEEEIVLAAHKKVLKQNKDALLILVPRHPDRFNTVTNLIQQNDLILARRSHQDVCLPETNVYLGDTMGELLVMYGACDVAFVGGSLIPRGGHNMLEPGALAKPILTGPHVFNFAEISDMFIASNALIKVQDADDLAQQLQKLMQDETLRQTYGTRALNVVAANRGALTKQLQLVEKFLVN